MYEDDLYDEAGRRNPMAIASIALGIAALICCTFFYISLPCAALAILCAILSRGKRKLSGKAKAGIICALVGMAATIAVTITAFHSLLTDSSVRNYVEQYIQFYLGDSSFQLDDLLGEFFPSFAGGSSTSSDGSAAETETEEERVHLRIATDEPETEAPAAVTSPAESVAEEATEAPATETEAAETEALAPSRNNKNETPDQIPEEAAPNAHSQGGGSFI
jgi:hypothetical protein